MEICRCQVALVVMALPIKILLVVHGGLLVPAVSPEILLPVTLEVTKRDL